MVWKRAVKLHANLKFVSLVTSAATMPWRILVHPSAEAGLDSIA
jgi:hypothetical protein